MASLLKYLTMLLTQSSRVNSLSSSSISSVFRPSPIDLHQMAAVVTAHTAIALSVTMWVEVRGRNMQSTEASLLHVSVRMYADALCVCLVW